MPRASTPRGRLRQVERWLRHHYPPPRPVEVRVRVLPPEPDSPADCGYIEQNGRGFRIVLNRTYLDAPLGDYSQAEALLHEWAHALAWAVDSDHGDEWALAYGRLYRHYYDRGGHRGADRFSPRPWR